MRAPEKLPRHILFSEEKEFNDALKKALLDNLKINVQTYSDHYDDDYESSGSYVRVELLWKGAVIDRSSAKIR